MATVTLIAPNGQTGDVPEEQVGKALAAGFKRGVPMLAPTGHRGHVPEDRVDEARKAGFVPDLPAPIPHGLQGAPEPSTATPENEGAASRFLRQSGIPTTYNLFLDKLFSKHLNPNIPPSGPQRRAEQNKVITKPITDIVDLIRNKDYGDAGNKLGETVGNMIPGVSQAGDIIKDIAQGAYGNIPPDLLGGIVQGLGLKYGGEALEKSNVANRAAATETEFLKNTQPAIASYGNTVGNKLKYMDDARKAIPLMQEQDPKIKVDLTSNKLTAPKVEGPLPPMRDTFIPANEKAIAKIDEQFNPMVARANTFGITGNGGAITQSVIDSIPEKMRLLNPTGYQRLVDTYANAYGTLKNPKFFSPDKLIDLRATTNAQLSKFYEGLSGQIDDTLAFDANKNSLNAEVKALRNEIYNKIDPEHNGEWAAELMDRRGALQNIRDAHEKLVNKNMGTAQPTAGEKAVGAVGDVAGLATGLKGAKNIALEHAARPATAEANIEKAFRQKMAPLPGPTGGTPPPIYPRNPLQLGPGTPQVNAPGYNPSDVYSLSNNPVKVTTGAPLQVVEPAAPLTPTEPGQFVRQTGMEELPAGQGIMFHEPPATGEFRMPPDYVHDPSLNIPSRTFKPSQSLKSNPKYTWYDEAEQRPQLEMERTPKVPDVFQRLLHEGEQPEGPLPGQPSGNPPPMQSNTPVQKPMNFDDIMDILRRGGF